MRAPGFPAAHALSLSAPRAVTAIDALAVVDDRVRAARDAARAVLEQAPRSKPVNRALGALGRGEVTAGSDGLPADAVALLDALRTADAARAAARAAAERALDDDSRAVATFLLGCAADPRFREALLWQNRFAVHGSIAALARRPVDAADSKTREHRRLVASYVQRYCVKNDTIGFFGPVGWAELTDAAAPIAVHPGGSLLATRKVYFENWGIAVLAQRLAEDPELRPYLRPRRIPSLWLDGGVLHHPNGKRIELPPAVARLLALIDGARTARAIAGELSGELDEVEVFELLAELEQKKLVTWTLEIPTQTFEPERYLRELIDAAEGPARDRALAALAALEACRDHVARAAGDPDALDAALRELEATFEQTTGASATRKGGETYAGRMLVFEDCRRDLQVELGREIIERLGPPLALVLDSARWYTFTIGARYEQAVRAVYDELRREHGATVEYLRFAERLPALFPGARSEQGIVADVLAELHARWAALLDLGDARSVVRRTADLRPGVAAAFRAPAPGWPGARHHAPDVLIAAESVDAIRRGAYHLVLGEVHVALNTVMPCLLKEHPAPELLVRAREADLPEPAVQPVWSREINRADFFSLSRHDFDLERGESRSTRPRDHVLASGELVLEDTDGQLVVRTRDRRCSFPIIAFLERHLIAESFARFGLLAARDHLPRVTIDDLVVQRETWRFSAETVAFADEATEVDRFLAARRFAERHGMPRMVYAKTDAEAKPFFVDFTSPILVDILARNIKRAKRVALSEMSPGLADCWLPDAQGERYTSELRLVAVDARSWAPGR